MTESPDSFDIGDIIRSIHLNPLDAIVKSPAMSEEQVVEQVRPPTADELAEIEELAFKAGEIQDQIKGLLGDRPKELARLKDQLKERLLRHGLKEVSIAGRPPIELTESNSRKATRAAIIDVMVNKLGPKEGKMKALNLWNQLPQSTSYSISIPDPSPPDE